MIIQRSESDGIWNVRFTYEDANADDYYQEYTDQSMFTFLENLSKTQEAQRGTGTSPKRRG